MFVYVCLIGFSSPGLGILSRQLSLIRTGIFPGDHDEGREERKSDYVPTDHNFSWPRRDIRTQRSVDNMVDQCFVGPRGVEEFLDLRYQRE